MEYLQNCALAVRNLQHGTPLLNAYATSALIERELNLLRSYKLLKGLYSDEKSTSKSDWLPYDGAVPDGKQEAAALLPYIEFLEIFNLDLCWKTKLHDAIQSHFIIRFPKPGTKMFPFLRVVSY
jgi:hypothetical protein